MIIMRLWSLHPSYLDQKGLCGLWREAIQAQKVLFNLSLPPHARDSLYKQKIPYQNHPQLDRFKSLVQNGVWINVFAAMSQYLLEIYKEANKRRYSFDFKLIYFPPPNNITFKNIHLNSGQLFFEFELLKKKIMGRAKNWWDPNWDYLQIKQHPIFEIVPGGKASWERM